MAPADLGTAAHTSIQGRVVQQLPQDFAWQDEPQGVFQSTCQIDLVGVDHLALVCETSEDDNGVQQQLEAHVQQLMQTLRKRSCEADIITPDRYAAEGTCRMLRTASSQPYCPLTAMGGRLITDVEILLHSTTLSCLDDQQPSKGIFAAPHGMPAAAHAFPEGSEECGLLFSHVTEEAMASGSCPAVHNPLQTPMAVQQEVGGCAHRPDAFPEVDRAAPDLLDHRRPNGVLHQLRDEHPNNQSQLTGRKQKVCSTFGCSCNQDPLNSLPRMSCLLTSIWLQWPQSILGHHRSVSVLTDVSCT